MTTREAADRLGIKPRSVVWAIRRQLIRAEKRGRDYWIEEEEIERYARERRPQHRPSGKLLVSKTKIASNIAQPDDLRSPDENRTPE